jgi:hypothetical protein
MRALASLGRVLYRFLVGCFVGTIVAGICILLSIGLTFTKPVEKLHGTVTVLVMYCGLSGTWYGSFAGAVIAALFAAKRPSGRRLRIGNWVILGSIMGLAFGALLTAGAGIIAVAAIGIEDLRKTKEEMLYLLLGVGLTGGVAAGILAAVCSLLSRKSIAKPQ